MKIAKSQTKFDKVHSIQFRFLATVILAMLAITILIGGLSIYEVDNYVQSQAESYVNVKCDNEVTQINDTFGDMEKSVKIMESYLMGFLTGEEDLSNRALQEKIIESTDVMFADVAKHTSEAIAYYFRFNPEISDGKSGLFYSKLNGSDEYTYIEPTDLMIYDKNDTEHVGWFWQPYEAGKPIWMKPYHNQNNNILMISYVIPMYYEEQFIGVVGMDFDYKVLSERVQKIEVYENGFAYLSMDGAPVSDINSETDNAEEYLSVSGNLVNGMTLVLSASYDDIRQIRYEIAVEILFAVLIISVLFTVLAALIVKKIVHPLKKLTDASVKLSNGDYDVDIVSSNMSEIKLLSMSFQKMTKRLREREERLHLSANRDSLTGLRNTTSYKSWENKIDKAIESDTVDFGLAVFDINDLKKTNDKYGHGAGNEVIIVASAIISGSFKHSPVFRIGGDEFLVILENEDLENYETLLENMEIKSAGTIIEDKIPVTIAGGFARFDAQKDTCVADVFKRADEIMYENKRKTKATTV